MDGPIGWVREPPEVNELHDLAPETRSPGLSSLGESLDDSEVQRGLEAAARAGLPLRELEDRYIDAVLASCGGRKGEAAQRLGIDRKTLYRREIARLSRSEPRS